MVVFGAQPRHEQVCRLDVAMHEPTLMRLSERPARLAQEHDDTLGGLRAEPGDDAVQIESVEKLHDVVEAAAVIHAEVVQLHGVRRPQTRSHVRFTLETPDELLSCGARRNVVTNELHGRGTREQPVPGQPDFAHPARAEERDQAIAAHGDAFVEQLLVDLEDRAPGEKHRTLQHGAKLADVSRPCVDFEPAHGIWRYAIDDLPDLPRMPSHEIVDERGDILSPIGKPRHADAVAGKQTKERQEVPGHRLAHIARRRGDHPHVTERRFTAIVQAAVALDHVVEGALELRR